MKLQRKEISNEIIGKHSKINTKDKDDVKKYLSELIDLLNKYEYESDSDFLFCGRKKFVYDEINGILDGTIDSISNPIYFVLGSLEEFISSNNYINPSDDLYNNLKYSELINKNNNYSIRGIICLEEAETIRKIIKNILDHLDTFIL